MTYIQEFVFYKSRDCTEYGHEIHQYYACVCICIYFTHYVYMKWSWVFHQGRTSFTPQLFSSLASMVGTGKREVKGCCLVADAMPGGLYGLVHFFVVYTCMVWAGLGGVSTSWRPCPCYFVYKTFRSDAQDALDTTLITCWSDMGCDGVGSGGVSTSWRHWPYYFVDKEMGNHCQWSAEMKNTRDVCVCFSPPARWGLLDFM